MKRHFFLLLLLIPYLLLAQTTNKGQVYGKINIAERGQKIYSQAYIHYPQVFSAFDREARFDIVSFEERFLDTTYANTIKIDPTYRDSRVYESLALEVYEGGNKNEIWFRFKKDEGFASLLTRKNPEINAFIGMVFVYKGDLTKKEFEEEFIFFKRKSFLKRKIRKRWTDFRVYYDNPTQSFTIKLKNMNGFSEIESYPRYTSLSRDLKDSQERYVKINAKYLKSLKKRKIKFDKGTTKRKNIYYKSLSEFDANLWKTFQKNYMTEEEKSLPREEWLTYYDKVIANERKAMGNAVANIDNLIRSIRMDSYSVRSNQTLIPLNDTGGPLKTLYKNNKEERLAITAILMVDADTKTYRRYYGSQGIKTIVIDNPKSTNYVMVAWLRNGDVGFLSQKELSELPVNEKGQALVTLNIMNKKLASVQTIRSQLTF